MALALRVGGALLATPSADRPKDRWPSIDDTPLRSCQQLPSSLQTFCNVTIVVAASQQCGLYNFAGDYGLVGTSNDKS